MNLGQITLESFQTVVRRLLDGLGTTRALSLAQAEDPAQRHLLRSTLPLGWVSCVESDIAESQFRFNSL